MPPFVTDTGDIGADRGDAVNQTLAFQKIKRAIDRGRFRRCAIEAEASDQIIGFQGFCGRQQQLKDTAARSGQLLALILQTRLYRSN